ncbi:MAG: carbohydrate ABC transporter permease, partial [Chloroflexi bacterium]|nr:carbohydrate ABC transporter permease [Chloroflexota bacterium]
WLDTLAALVVPHLGSAFAVIMLRQFMKSFPLELVEAARLDGAGSWAILWRMMVPNLRAPLATLAILSFISTWNEYFWPLLVTSRPDRTVVQVGLQMFLSSDGEQWGPLMAAATVATVPVLLVYVLFQRQVVEAFVRSGLR